MERPDEQGKTPVQSDDAATGHALRSVRLLLEAYAGAELPQWELFAANVRAVRLEPGGVLFSIDEPHPYVYFVQHGLLKAQVRTEGGRLATCFFPEDGDVLASLTALGMEGVRRSVARDLHPRSPSLEAAAGARSMHTVTAIEQCLLIRVAFRVVEHLANQHVAWARLVAALAMMHATTLQADASWQRSTPEQRYRSFLCRNPALASRLTQRDLANYLNVTDVALSRIAKRVRTESTASADPAEDGEPEAAADPVGALAD
jgi:CRP-like cAMP-binding protein